MHRALLLKKPITRFFFAPQSAGHSDMFSCRGGKTCLVTELGDGNFDSSLAEAPHFVM
jgi:hypothetical protein